MFMTLEGKIHGIAQQAGLPVESVKILLDAGWTFVKAEEGPNVWIGPHAAQPVFIPHNEPWCEYGCGNNAPHRHGFACNNTCKQCHGVCHPDCPAYKE